ncbi:MAG: mRNA surveillance protein pelota [Candidatus Diapherotrites archaeon]|nr:mRNA surveillance protein pelota [Candidatus Diapherotrites archaeon]
MELHESSGDLRIIGRINATSSPLVELKTHHALEVFPGKKIRVTKKKLKKYQVDRLEKAKIAAGRDFTVLVVLDDEEAEIAVLKEFSFEKKAKILAGKSGKMFKGADFREQFFEKIQKKLEEISPKKAIFAGPGFTKNELQKYLQEKKFKYRAFFESINSVGITGLNELIKSGVIEKIVAETQLVKETKLVEKILQELGKPRSLAAIDLKEIKNSIEMGAVEHLLLTDEFLLSNRKEAEEMLEKTEELKGEIHIVSAKTDAGKKIRGFGGAAAVLRFSAV